MSYLTRQTHSHSLHCANLCALVAAAAMVVAWIVPECLHAQSTYGDRVTVATTLTTQKDFLRMTLPPQSQVAVGNSVLGPLTLRDPRTGSITVNGPGAIDVRLIRTANGFKLQVRLRDNIGEFMSVPPGSHELACDLEHSWLRRSWGLVFRDALGGEHIGDGTCRDVSQRFTQDYFMWLSTGLNGKNDVRGALLQGGMSEWDLAGRFYNVPMDIDATTTQTRDDLVTFTNTENSTDKFLAVVQRSAGPTRDSGIGKLAFTEVTFTPPPDLLPPGEQYVDRISLEAHTHARTNECSASTGGPDANSAYVRLSFSVRPAGGGAAQVSSCEWKVSSGNPDADNLALWDHFDQKPTSWAYINDWAWIDVDPDGYLTLQIKSDPNNECINPGTYRIMQVRSRAIPSQYCEMEYPWDGQFVVDNMTGELTYQPVDPSNPSNVLPPIPVPCLPFATTLSGYNLANHVIKASATELGDSWPIDQTEFQRNPALTTWGAVNRSNNKYETGEGRWRSKSAYVYRTSVIGAVAPNERVYNDAGVFTMGANEPGGLRLFDWRNPSANVGTKWLRTTSILKYSPYGIPLEQTDFQGIHGTAQYAHDQNFRRLTAVNAEYPSVGFQSFEEHQTSGYVTGVAHTGKTSYQMPAKGTASATMLTVRANMQLRTKGVLIRFWAKRTYDHDDQTDPIVLPSGLGGATPTKIAQTGEWTLYEARYTPPGTAVDGTMIDIQLIRNTDDAVWIDDIRAQPYDAEMTCYVYDLSTWRVVAVLDPENFATHLQYDGQGALVRILDETDRGMQTASEFESNVTKLGYRLPGVLPAQRTVLGSFGSSSTAFASRAGDGKNAPTKQPQSVNLIDFNAGLDGVRLEFLKGNEQALDRLQALLELDSSKLTAIQRESLDRYGFRDVERAKLVLQAKVLEQRMDTLAAQATATTDSTVRRHLVEQRNAAEASWKKIVHEQLGVSEEEVRQMYRALDEIEKNPDAGE